MCSIKNFSGKTIHFILLFISLYLLLSNQIIPQEKQNNNVKHQYFNEVINGVRLYYHIVTADPQKPYVFYLHGGPGANSLSAEETLTYLTADKVNWVFMDQRGSGRSAVYNFDPSISEMKRNQLTPDLMVEDIEQIRLKNNLGKIIIYGHSWGGNLAAYYTYAHPESLLGYIIASCSHNWKEDTENILTRYTYIINETTRIFENWIKNGYSDELYFYIPQLKSFLEAQNYDDIIDIIFNRQALTNAVKARLEKIIANNNNVKSKLTLLKETKHSPKRAWEILSITSSLGSYGWSKIPEFDYNRVHVDVPMKQNSVIEAWADSLPKDNNWYYPQFKVQGVFWCGLNDLWGPSSMIPASKLAPNSSYFVFPRSGHDYLTVEPNLFVRKLLEAINSFTGEKKETTGQSRVLWQKFVGLYKNTAIGECNIILEGESIIGYINDSKIIFEPITDKDFIMHGGPGSGGELTFILEPDGTCNSFVGKGLTFIRVAK